MATIVAKWVRPAVTADYRAPSATPRAGITLAVIGLLLAVITLIANIVAGSLVGDARATSILAWSFGLTTTAFSVIKLGIAVVLWGIIMKLWVRVESLKATLPALRGQAVSPAQAAGPGEISTPFGPATISAREPRPLFIHGMARALWAPMLVMGVTAVVIGLILSFVQAGNALSNPGLAGSQGAWVQGVQFLGEGFLLSGISFLLGTIMWAIRTGGGEVQALLGLPVRTLKMPAPAKVFVALMMLGLAVELVQFILYIVVANTPDPQTVAVWSTWLGPLREAGLGLILSGIVLALVAIGNVLGFQFHRVQEIIRAGSQEVTR